MVLTSMETKFCKLPLDFEALLSEDVENSRLASCSEIESIDQFIELLISTAPGEHAFDKEFGCEIFFLDFESIVSHTRWEGQFSEFDAPAVKKRVQVYVYGTLVHTGEKRCFYYVIYLGPISTR